MGLLDYNTEKPERTLSNVVSINPNQRFIDEGKLALEEQMSASENPYARMFEKTVPTSQESLIEMGKHRIKEREHGLLKSAGLAIARGVPALGQLTGHALKTLDPEGGIDVVDRFGQKIIDVSEKMAETDIMRPRMPVDEGFVGRGIRGGLESTIPSFAPMVAGAGAGAAIGSVVPGVGTVIGGIIGGAAATLGIHGLGVYGQEKERYLQQGIDEKTAHKAATQQGLVEGGIETVSNIIGMLTFGWGKLASQPLKQTAKELLKTPVKTFAKNLTKNALLNEVPTEMIQGALGAKIDERIGLLPEGAWQEAAVESIIPALTMSVIFGLGAQGATSLQRNNIKKQLNSENPKERVRAAEYIAGNIDDNELRQAWIDTVTPLINEGLPININADFTQTTSNEIDQVKADIKSGLMAEGIKSGDLTSEMMVPVIEKVAAQDPALADQITDMFAVKETDLTENERRFEEDPLDAENNAEYLDKYIKRAALPEGVALTTEEKIAERAKILEEAPRRPAEVAAEVFEKELPVEPTPTEPTAEVAREPVGVEKKPVVEKIEKAEVKEPWKTDTKLESRKYQEKYPERTVHESWDKANSPRHDFEGAGDILREFQEKDQDPHYISEKLGRVKKFVDGHLNNTLHFDDSLDAAIKHEPEKLNRLISQYESQPVLTESQETAKSLILNIMKGNFKEAGNNLNTIENNVGKWTEQALKPLPPKPPKAKPPEAVTKKIEGEVTPEPTLKVEKIELKELQAIKTKKEGAKIVRSDTYETQEEFLTRIIKEKDLEVDNTHDIRPEDLTLQEYADSVNKNELETWVDGLGMEDSPPKFSSPADLKITYEHPEATREEIEKIKRGRVKPKVEKEKVEVTPEKKEPWKITRDEYVKQYIEEQRAADFPEHMITDKYKESIMRDHFAVVSEAFAGDKTIPPEVLKDYPDLKAEKKVEVETTPEGKELSVDLTKKEEAAVTPKQQKEYLLAEIDKAIETELKTEGFEGGIETAKDLLKRRVNPLIQSKTSYEFEVPNDGTFNIVGSSLFEFKSRAKSTFPSTIISKQFKPTRPAKKAVPTAKYNKIIVVPPKEIKSADIDRIFKEVADTEARDITGAVLLNPFQNWLLSQDITKAVKDKIRSVAGKDYIEEARVKIETQDIEYARSMVEYTRGEFEELQGYYDEYKAGEKTLKQIAEETEVKRSGNELAQEASDAKTAYYNAVAHLEQLEKPTGVEAPEGKVFATKTTKIQDPRQDFQEMVIAGQKIIDEIKEAGLRKSINADGTITIYHGTSEKNADKIMKEGRFEKESFFSPLKGRSAFGSEGAKWYGRRGKVLSVKVDARDINFVGTGEIEVSAELVRDVNGIWRSPERIEARQGMKYSVKQATKPQDTITRADLKSIFSKMKNISTGVDKDGNFFFRPLGKPVVTIYEVNEVKGYIQAKIGEDDERIPVGSYLRNKIELKTSGEGFTADIGTAWHEFTHFLIQSGVMSGNDVKSLSEAITRDKGIKNVTEEDIATYVGDRLSEWQGQKNLRIRRVLKKIADFVNSIWEFVSRTRTARGVLADIETGRLIGKEGAGKRADTLIPAFQMAGEKAIGAPEAGKVFATKPTKDYKAMLRRYQEAHTTPLVDELVKKTQADIDPVSATPEETKAFFKDIRLMPKRFRSEVLSIRDMKWYHKAFETPYVLAKKFVSMKAAVKTEINRHESRTKKMFGYYHGDLADLQKHMQKNPEDLKTFESLVWEWEGHRFSEKEVPTDWYSVIEDVKDDDYGGIQINPEHYTEVRKYLKKQGVKDVVADGFVAVRKTLDNVLIEADATMRGNNIDQSDLQEFRKYIGTAHNYFSHIREGNSYIKITNLNTKKTVYREHFWTLKERALPERKMAKTRTEKWLNDQLSSGKLSGKRSDYLVSPAQKVTKLPDEIFFQIPVEALSQISIEAGKGLSASRVHYEALRLMKKEGLSEKEAHEKAGKILTADMGRILARAMSDVLKTRGWGKHAIQRQNIPGFKKTDVFETLSGYLTGYAGFATKIQAAKEHSKTLRDIDARKTPAAYKYTSEYVRDMLANADKTDQMVDRLRGLFFVKYLGGVVKSGVVNLTQNAVMAGPILSQYTKFSHIKLARAMKDTRRGITGKNAWMGKETDYKNLSKAEQKALTEMVETGAAQDLYLRELKGDIPGKGWGKYVRKVIDKSGIFMMIAEKFNRASTGLAAYRIAMNEGVLHEGNQTKDNHDLSVQFAKGVIYDSHFLYGKPNLPAGFRGGDFRKIARAAYTFRSFTHNYLDIMVDLMANQGTQGFKVAGRSLMNLMVVGGLTSIPFFKALSEVIKWASDDEDEDLLTEIRGTMSNKFMQDVLVYGLVGASGGFDLSGSLSIEVPRSFKDLIGVPYAVKEDYMNMVKSVKAGNLYRAVSETPFTPIVMRNAMRGIELYTKGQRTRGGKAINVPGKKEPRKITGAEAIKKGILGLQPLEVSSGYKAYRAATKMKRAIADRKRDWADRIANATIAHDFKKVREIKAEIREWNTLAKREGKRWRIVDITEMVKGRLTGKGLRSFPVKMRKEAGRRYEVWQ